MTSTRDFEIGEHSVQHTLYWNLCTKMTHRWILIPHSSSLPFQPSSPTPGSIVVSPPLALLSQRLFRPHSASRHRHGIGSPSYKLPVSKVRTVQTWSYSVVLFTAVEYRNWVVIHWGEQGRRIEIRLLELPRDKDAHFFALLEWHQGWKTGWYPGRFSNRPFLSCPNHLYRLSHRINQSHSPSSVCPKSVALTTRPRAKPWKSIKRV